MLHLLGGGCAASAPLNRRIDAGTQALGAVEAQGALRCAPRELAIARSHLEFARLEREQGSPSRVRQHLDVAEENLRAANVLSAPGRCASEGDASGSSPPAPLPATAPPPGLDTPAR